VKPEGEARTGIKLLLLWTFSWHLEGFCHEKIFFDVGTQNVMREKLLLLFQLHLPIKRY